MIPAAAVEAACNHTCNYICHRCGWCRCNPKEHWRMVHEIVVVETPEDD